MQRRSPTSPAYRACRDDCAMTQGLAVSSQAEATQQQMLSANHRLSAVLTKQASERHTVRVATTVAATGSRAFVCP